MLCQMAYENDVEQLLFSMRLPNVLRWGKPAAFKSDLCLYGDSKFTVKFPELRFPEHGLKTNPIQPIQTRIQKYY